MGALLHSFRRHSGFCPDRNHFASRDVKDPSGAVVPGASVTLANKAIGKTYSAVSNSDGSYAFRRFSRPLRDHRGSAGFGSQTKTAELLVNQPATIDFALSVQANQTTVDVSDTAQTLNTSDATVGDSVGSATIESLPWKGATGLAANASAGCALPG